MVSPLHSLGLKIGFRICFGFRYSCFEFLGKSIQGALVVGVFLIQAGLARADEDLYRRVAPATALIYKGVSPLVSSGTGFLIDGRERLVVTARHVIENPTGGLASNVFVIFAQSKEGEIITEAAHYRKNWKTLALAGKVVYDSVRSDLAIIQVAKLPAGIKPLTLAPARARPGQLVHLIGNASEPFGVVFSYCRGYVRNAFFWEEHGARVVATQLPTNRGDSGGPTLNQRGEVVGFASQSTTGSPQPKTSVFHDLQVTSLSICVSEIRAGLQEMQGRLLAGKQKIPNPGSLKGTFLGEVKPGSHWVLMEKDVLYRIRVQANGFVPDVRIDGIVVNSLPGPLPGPGQQWLHLYTPRETKNYHLQIGPFPGRDIARGPIPYDFTVDRVTFEPETAVKDAQLKLNEHVKKFKAGKAYDLTVRAWSFEPDVHIVDGTKVVLTRYNDGKRVAAAGGFKFLENLGFADPEYVTSLRFVAGKTGDYRILINPFSPLQNKPLKYTLQVAEPRLHFSTNGQLRAGDPLYPQAGPCHRHPVKLVAGKNYQIDLVTTAFDSRLLLEDSSGKVVVQGFDVEGFNGRLVFRPYKTAVYPIVATSHQNNARGPYTLVVTENPNAQAMPPRGNLMLPPLPK